MTSIEWRRREDLQAAAATLLENAHMKIMLDIMRVENTMTVPLPRLGTTDSDKAMAYGVEVGYQHALRKLALFAQPIKEQPFIESTFKPVT